MRHFPTHLLRATALALGLSLAFIVLGSCSPSSPEDYSGTANDEVAAAMADAEGGATAILEDSVAAISAETSAAAKSLTLTWDLSTPTISYEDDLGNVVAPASATRAVLSWTREGSFTGTRASGTSSTLSSLTFSGLQTSTWSVTGSVVLERSTTSTNGRIVTEASLTHSLNLSLNGPGSGSSRLIAGGSATTTGSFVVNGSQAFSRSYAWTFSGDGTATLKTATGTVVTVSVTVEGAS